MFVIPLNEGLPNKRIEVRWSWGRFNISLLTAMAKLLSRVVRRDRALKQEMFISFRFGFAFANGAAAIKIVIEPMITKVTKINPHSCQKRDTFKINQTKYVTFGWTYSTYVVCFER